MLSEESVGEGVSAEAVRCLPAWTRRSWDNGRDVRRERSCRSVGMSVAGGTEREMAVQKISIWA